MTARRNLSVAISHYDHVADLISGAIRPEGIEITPLVMPVEEIFYRFIHHREFDVSEMSFAKYVSLVASGATDLTAIPVFPSRMFRQSAIYVRSYSPLHDPLDLVGKRVGIPEWAQTAQVYVRGWLTDTLGLDLADIDWVQAGVNEPGRKEKVQLNLPKDVLLVPCPDSSLSEMLLSGEVDAISTAHPPKRFEEETGEIRQLLPNSREVEEAYYRSTRIFPIMHVIAIRRDVYEADRWIAGSLYKAFCQARDASVARTLELTASRFPIPWAAEFAQSCRELFGSDYFPYGVEANRTTIDAFLDFCHRQGVASRRLAPTDLFAPETTGSFRI